MIKNISYIVAVFIIMIMIIIYLPSFANIYTAISQYQTKVLHGKLEQSKWSELLPYVGRYK